MENEFKESKPKIDSVVLHIVVIFPLATYTRAGEISQLTVLGFRVYKRVGSDRKALGMTISG